MTITGAAGAGETSTTADRGQVQDRRLAAGAQEFEAMLLGTMLKPLRFGEAEASDEDSDSGAGGTVRSMGTEALAKAIAAGGGLGIGREILKQVGAQRAAHDSNGSATKV